MDPSICLVVSDSRGSAGVSEFGMKFPERVVEVGIAEQNLIGIASGLSVGKINHLWHLHPVLSLHVV
ncbi:MAG TPA: hypothetical protein DEA51_01730 [Erysipelotrichaceae bacterium]|nr:hypothetical protein [Erysipelotrichaceae bacterium]